MGPDYQLPEGGVFKQAEFSPVAGEEPGLAFFWVYGAPVQDKEATPVFRLQLYFARRIFFRSDAPKPDSTVAEFQQISEPFIGKKVNMTVSSRMVASEQDLQQTSLIRPLIGLASRSGGHAIKLTGAQYDILPPASGEMSWTFRESDRAVVTEMSAPLSNLEGASAQAFLDYFAPAFELFVIGSK
jgi:hypothetical protein